MVMGAIKVIWLLGVSGCNVDVCPRSGVGLVTAVQGSLWLSVVAQEKTSVMMTGASGRETTRPCGVFYFCCCCFLILFMPSSTAEHCIMITTAEADIVDIGPYLAHDANDANAVPDLAKTVANALRKTGMLVIRDPRVSTQDNETFLDLMERYACCSNGGCVQPWMVLPTRTPLHPPATLVSLQQR